MSNLIIGLFCPVTPDVNLTFYVNRLQGFGEVRLIMARQLNLGSIDVLVYPDGCGIFPDTPGLTHGERIFTPSKPINPFFYLFWNERPFQTIVEEREIPIVGHGDAAAMLWSELGGNIVVEQTGKISLYDKAYTPIENFFINKERNVYGAVTDFGLTEVIKQSIEDVKLKYTIENIEGTDNDEEDNDDGGFEPKPKPRIPAANRQSQ